MRYFVENTLENLTLIRTISDSFPDAERNSLFNAFKQHNTILLITEEYLTPKFRFTDTTHTLFFSEAELRELVFALSLEQ